MKHRLLLIVALCITINVLSVDDATVTFKGNDVTYTRNSLSATFDKKFLMQSSTLQNMIPDSEHNLENKNTVEYAVKELFKKIDNQRHMDLLVNALQHNSSQLDDQTKPSPEAIQFADSVNKDDLVGLINTIDFWAIEPLFDAVSQRLAQVIIDGLDLDLSQLPEPIAYKIKKQIDFFALKMTIGNMLQQTIVPFGKEPLLHIGPGVFNPKYAHIAFVKDNYHAVYIYDFENEKIIHTIKSPKGDSIISFKYNQDGSLFFVQLQNKDELLIYDTRNYQLLQTIPSHNYTMSNLKIAVWTQSAVTIYTQTATGIKQTNTFFPDNTILNALFSPNGNQIIIKTTNGSFLYDANNQELIKSWPLDVILISFSSDNTKVLVVRRLGDQTTVWLHDLSDMSKEPQTIYNDPQSIRIPQFSPDNSQVLIQTSDYLRIYNAEQPLEHLKIIQTPHQLIGLNAQYSPDSSQISLVTPAANKMQLTLYNTKNDSTKTIPLPGNYVRGDYFDYFTLTDNYQTYDLAPRYTPDSSHVYVITKDGKIFFYNKETAVISFTIDFKNDIFFLRYSPDGSHMLITRRYDYVLIPTLFEVNFNKYDIEQLQFLIKAALQWKQEQPYLIQTKNEAEIYISLDPILRNQRLFLFPLIEQIKANITQRLSRFIPDIETKDISINALSKEQLDLLTKASEQWTKKEAYEVTHDEVEIYYTLPSHLQDYRLFNFPADVHAQKSAEIKQHIKKESSRIKDFFANVTYRVYKLFGWRKNMPLPKSQPGAKEAEKEEDI